MQLRGLFETPGMLGLFTSSQPAHPMLTRVSRPNAPMHKKAQSSKIVETSIDALTHKRQSLFFSLWYLDKFLRDK